VERAGNPCVDSDVLRRCFATIPQQGEPEFAGIAGPLEPLGRVSPDRLISSRAIRPTRYHPQEIEHGSGLE
jgi:hypothetical protein